MRNISPIGVQARKFERRTGRKWKDGSQAAGLFRAMDDAEIAALARKLAERLFPNQAQQEACARHIAQLLSERAERKERFTRKLLRQLRNDAIVLTMRPS